MNRTDRARAAAEDLALSGGRDAPIEIVEYDPAWPDLFATEREDQFKVKYAVAVDEANKGRPISRKVAELMRTECSSGIFIFTADERFVRELDDGSTEEVWRPSENVVYELGAASILYENRIVIFKEKGVTFPTDFSDLGFIEFERDQLVSRAVNSF